MQLTKRQTLILAVGVVLAAFCIFFSTTHPGCKFYGDGGCVVGETYGSPQGGFSTAASPVFGYDYGPIFLTAGIAIVPLALIGVFSPWGRKGSSQ